MEISGRVLRMEELATYMADTGRGYDDVVIHHTASPAAAWDNVKTPLALKTYYEGLGWDSGPHLFIHNAEAVAFTPWSLDGTGVAGHNRRTRHIEIVGDYTSALPNAATWGMATKAAAWALRMQHLGTEHLHPHREYNATQCPGDSLYASWPSFVESVDAELTLLQGPAGEVGTLTQLVDKACWWAENIQRQREGGNDQTANALHLGLIQLLARMREMGRN